MSTLSNAPAALPRVPFLPTNSLRRKREPVQERKKTKPGAERRQGDSPSTVLLGRQWCSGQGLDDFTLRQAASLVTRRAVPDCVVSLPDRGGTDLFFTGSSKTRMRELLSHSSTSLGTAITALRAFPRGLRTGRASSRSHLCTVLTPRPM